MQKEGGGGGSARIDMLDAAVQCAPYDTLIWPTFF